MVPLYIAAMNSLLPWICLDFESVFRGGILLKLTTFYFCAIISQVWISLHVTQSLSVSCLANVL